MYFQMIDEKFWECSISINENIFFLHSILEGIFKNKN